jgi:hypothetical protein
MSPRVVVLDRVLAHLGPGNQGSSCSLAWLRRSHCRQAWSKRHANTSQLEAPSGGEELLDRVQELAPKDEKQRLLRLLQAQATSVVLSLGETHWLQYAQGAISVSMPLLIALIFGLTTIFVSFGLFAPGNATVLTSLLVSALSVAAAILLILELYSPYSGLIQVSSVPRRGALTQLGN